MGLAMEHRSLRSESSHNHIHNFGHLVGHSLINNTMSFSKEEQ